MAQKEIKSWKEASEVALSLKSWLARHCPSCGKAHTPACLRGGRCTHLRSNLACGTMLVAVRTLGDAAHDAASLLGV